MTKYRIRLANGRVLGPYLKNQLFELKTKGSLKGTEEAQVYPTGDWAPLKSYDFFEAMMDENKTSVLEPSPKEETFLIDLNKIRSQKNVQEIEEIDVTHHQPVMDLTGTAHISAKAIEEQIQKELEIERTEKTKKQEAEKKIVWENLSDKTLINPDAQKEIEKMRKKQREIDEKKKEEEERLRLAIEQKTQKEEQEKNLVLDDSTQIFKLDKLKDQLLVKAEEEDNLFSQEVVEYKRSEEKAAIDEVDEEELDKEKKKAFSKKLLIGAVIGAILLLLFDTDEKPKQPTFNVLAPRIIYPEPYEKDDLKKSKIDYDKGREYFANGTYPDLVRAGIVLKSSYENDLKNIEALSLLVRVYAEQLKYSKNKLEDAQIIFNMIQGKRPHLISNVNGAIGINLFYMAINKEGAAADVLDRFYKLHKDKTTQDLFAVFMSTYLDLGNITLARSLKDSLVKAPAKNRYTYRALIDFSIVNEEMDKAMEYASDAIKNNPNLVGFYLTKAELLIKKNQFVEASKLLVKPQELGLERNDLDRAKFLELKGLIIAQKGDVAQATKYFQSSLKLKDSPYLRMRLANLKSAAKSGKQSATDKLIDESKALKYLNNAKEFFGKNNYQLALVSATRAIDAYEGHIPSALFLSKVQIRLGLVKQGLKTLQDLMAMYPDDMSINMALADTYIDTYKFYDAKNRIGILSGTDLKNSWEFASLNGKLYMMMGDQLQSLTWLRNSINLNPLNDKDVHLMAELLIERNDFANAKLMLNKCMELDPVNPEYRISYAKLVYELQDDKSAIGYLVNTLDEFGENPRILAEIAIFYYRSGKAKDFEDYKKRIEGLVNPDKTIYEFLIKAALIDDRYKDVPGLVEKLITIEPGDLQSMMTAGKILFESGQLVEAAKWFKRVQDRLDTYPKVQYYIAKIKYLSKDYDGALVEVEKDMKYNGENDADLILMAQIFVQKDKLVEAENLFKKAQKINPKAFESLMGLADISTKRNNFDLALDLYKKAMRQEGEEPIIHKKIGDVYRLLGQGALAVESYKMYLEMDPESEERKQIESYINLMQ